MRRLIVSLFLSFLSLAPLGNAYADSYLNVYSFEQPSPDPTNPFWPFTVTEGTQVAIVESALSNDTTTYIATHGSKFLVLGAGDPTTSVAATFSNIIIGSALSFDFAFLGNSAAYKNDYASFTINGSEYLLADIQSCGGDYADCHWSSVSFSAPSETILMSFHSVNVVNFSGDSELLIDNIRISQTMPLPVPEPETWAMLLAGLGLVGLQLRGMSRNRDAV